MGKGADQNFAPFLPRGPALSNFIKYIYIFDEIRQRRLSVFNTQSNRPSSSPAIFKHVGQVPYSRGFKFGEKGPIKILPHFCLQVRRCQISSKFLSVFNTQTNKPRGLPAIFKHVGNVPYSRCFKFGENTLIKILPHFCLQVRRCQISSKFLSLFNTQPNRPRASPAIFKHVWQVPYSRGFKFGENGLIKILPHFCLQVRRCQISSKFLSLFNTQPNRPRASPAIFKHAGQVPYSTGFKFGKKGPIKFLSM